MHLFIEYLHSNPQFFFAVVVTVVVSICLHELAHGAVAVWLGDRTPIERGHMTLNPAVHMGLFSIVVLLLSGIAWGSMPVDPRRLRGRYGHALVSLAGPLSNLLLAAIALGALGLWMRHDERLPEEMAHQQTNLQFFLRVFGFTNVHLAMFNLIPIPPLDGAGVLGNLSRSYGRLMESLSTGGGAIVVFILVFSFAGNLIFPIALAMSNWFLARVVGS